MSRVVKVAEKLDWGCGPYFKIFYVCGVCHGAYKSEKELIRHKIKVHLDSEQRKRFFQNRNQKKQSGSKLGGDGQIKNKNNDKEKSANDKSANDDKRMKDNEPKSLKQEPIDLTEGEEGESEAAKLRRSARSRKRKPTHTDFITWEEEILWEAGDNKQQQRTKENNRKKSRKLDCDQWSMSSSGSASGSASTSGSKLIFDTNSADPPQPQIKKDPESGSYFPCNFCKTSYRISSYRDKHEREAHGGASYIRK